MEETVVQAPLLIAPSHQPTTLAGQDAAVLAPVLSVPKPPLNQSVETAPSSVLELSSELPTQQLQASQEMSLVAGSIVKADAQWLRDASNLSVDEIAAHLRRLAELEQQTQIYAHKLAYTQNENLVLQKTGEQSLQLQYVGFGLAALFALAYGYSFFRKPKPRTEVVASSILFGDSQSAQLELDRALAASNPETKEEASAAIEAAPQKKITKQSDLESPIAAAKRIEPEIDFSLEVTPIDTVISVPEEDHSDTAPSEGAPIQVQTTASNFAKHKSWYQRLLSSKAQPSAVLTDSVTAADVLALSDDEREDRIDSVWEDSKDWLREERITAEREAEPAAAAALPILAPIAVTVPSNTPQDGNPIFVDDIAPQPGQPLIDYIRSLHRIVQRLLDQGQFGQAGILLYEHVRAVPQTSPWAYLTFLSLYHEPTAKYLEMRQRFLDRFGREAPHIGEEKSNLALARGIADYQYSMAQLSQSWPGERAVLLLEEWLAVSNKRIFTLYAYNELFMLYDVLEDLHGVSLGTNFAALTA